MHVAVTTAPTAAAVNGHRGVALICAARFVATTEAVSDAPMPTVIVSPSMRTTSVQPIVCAAVTRKV